MDTIYGGLLQWNYLFSWVEKKYNGIEGVLLFTINPLVIKRLFRDIIVFFFTQHKYNFTPRLTISWVVAQEFFNFFKNIKLIKIFIYLLSIKIELLTEGFLHFEIQ
jgi:hypothetical protein